MRFFRRKASPTEVPSLTVRELKRRIDAGDHPMLIDVRQPEAHAASPDLIPGAVRIPPTELPEVVANLPRDRALILYCT